MTIIRQDDFIASIADALQFISYYHPRDFVESMSQAYEKEASPAAKDAIGQILVNSRMCAQGLRPLCQDTGIVVAFVEVGMNVQWASSLSIEEMVNEGVRIAYSDPDNPLRASIVADPAGTRKNTGDNTPAVTHIEMVQGDKVSISIAAKGGGSENKSRLAMLNPSDNIVQWVTDVVPQLGAGWCPPGVLGIGIGGTAEKAMLLAKKSLMAPIDIQELITNGPDTQLDELRLEIYEAVNRLGIGAQGLGGLTTVLDVKILDYPTHAASKPVALIPNCAATRHIHFELNGEGPAELLPPSMEDWPDVSWTPGVDAKKINLDTLSKNDLKDWKPGDTLLLSGKLLTGRDAAHKRLVEMIEKGQPMPVDFTNRFIYYVGPVDAVRDEVIGPAGPTTATRMDKFTESVLANTGLIGMVGKAERGANGIDAIKRHEAAYLIATGGAAYLVAKAIKKAKVVAFEDLGMEAIYEFEVENMPVTVAVDSQGNSVHQSGPKEWKIKIADALKK